MINKSSKLKQLNTLGLTALVLLGPFALYYVFYFSDQKSYFTNRDFRLLAVLSKQIELKVDNIGGAYHKAAEAAADSTVAAPAAKNRKVTHSDLNVDRIDSFLRPITEDGTTIKAATDAGKPD